MYLISPPLEFKSIYQSVKKIFHFARADLAFISRYLKTDVQNIDCTKIKSKLCRTYTDKHGLKELIKEFIGIDISKQYQSSDFGGELSQAQLKYCANDVVHLHKINNSLNQILLRENRKKLYENTINLNTHATLTVAIVLNFHMSFFLHIIFPSFLTFTRKLI